MHICIYYMHVHMYACTHVHMYACTHARAHICMYIGRYIVFACSGPCVLAKFTLGLGVGARMPLSLVPVQLLYVFSPCRCP